MDGGTQRSGGKGKGKALAGQQRKRLEGLSRGAGNQWPLF